MNNQNSIPLLFLFLLFSCKEETTLLDSNLLYERIESSVSNIDFRNDLSYSEEVNVYTFRNFYNGAGAALGDFNNDGLVDVFFCGNQVDNRLYFNKGNFEFLDGTQLAGVASQNVWSTGISLVDINGDGWLDYYVSKSGDINSERRHNELFINQGVTQEIDGISIVSFKEESAKYGLNDIGLSTHAAFFDYDRDGDLDCYLLNNSFKSVGNYDLKKDQRNIRDEEGGNKLLKNNTVEGVSKDQPIFEDVSSEAGIYGSAIGFGLGVTIGDVNLDGWPDIFVSNDFFEKDYLYINQKDGSFEEQVNSSIGELSMGSMGADLGDINNDGKPELFVTEMLPNAENRLKSKAQFQNWNTYLANEESGYHRQFARNVLQLNIGKGKFSEVGRLAGVEATDWSWGALIFDMDNNGHKDIFVANGIYKDLLDQDYINFYSNPAEVRKIIFDKENGGIDKLIDKMPSNALPNFAFKNKGDLNFSNATAEWGLDEASFSNGAAYGDLDNDGDLDLVVNNINMPVMVFRNTLDTSSYMQMELVDTSSYNRMAYGAKVYLYHGDSFQYQELYPAKGFMSSVHSRIHFGLGDNKKVDSVKVVWPDQTVTKIVQPKIDTILYISKTGSTDRDLVSKDIVRKPLMKVSNEKIKFKHHENRYSDFDKEPLKLRMHSNIGPACCSGDINNDGLQDFYIGGANGQEGILFVQKFDNSFVEINTTIFNGHKNAEDVDCIFFDADNDGDQDLYVASGSSEYGPNNSSLADRLYLNDGNSSFSLSNQILPSFRFENSSSVKSIDFDGDSDEDLVVSSFIKPYLYGVPSNIYLLENDGSGKFSNVSTKKAPQFQNSGMISDLAVGDIDNDGDEDIVVVGEWMGVAIFKNNAGSFERDTSHLTELKGLWNSIELNDIDLDGNLDMLVGNLGLNSRIKANKTLPVKMYINDFDRNGKAEQIICYTKPEGEFTFVQRTELLKQLPYLNKLFPNYESFAGKTSQELFSSALLDSSLILNATELSSGIIWNNGNNNFEFQSLPVHAQLSSIYATYVYDIDGDKIKDIILGGNQSRIKPEIGINNGSKGLALKGIGNRKFISMDSEKSGLSIEGEIREIVDISTKNNFQILVARNNDLPVILKKQ